jgi:hypothetical protein
MYNSLFVNDTSRVKQQKPKPREQIFIVVCCVNVAGIANNHHTKRNFRHQSITTNRGVQSSPTNDQVKRKRTKITFKSFKNE